MIISINGDEGSGKSTIAKLAAKELGYPHYSTGDIYRDLARKRGMTLAELHELSKIDPSIDSEVDSQLIDLPNHEASFVIDSRLAWHFLPQSIKIFLTVDDRIAAKRIYLELQKDNTRNEALSLDSENRVLDNLRSRRARDDDRYQRYYQLNIRDIHNYDFVLDTTQLRIEDVLTRVLAFIKQKN